MIYIIIATNIYGVDEKPVVVYDEKLAIEEMKKLMVWGIIERKPSVIQEFIMQMDRDQHVSIDENKLDSYDTMLHNKLADTFFEYLETRNDYKKNTTSMCIRLSDNHECDVYEVGYWKQEE